MLQSHRPKNENRRTNVSRYTNLETYRDVKLCITDKRKKLAMRRNGLDWSWKYFFLSIRSNQWAEACSTWRRFKME